MIETLLSTILKIALFTSLIDILSSAFKLQSYIRLVSNFIIMTTLISPFTGLKLQDIKFDREIEKFFYEKENYELSLDDSSQNATYKAEGELESKTNDNLNTDVYYDEIAKNYSENTVYKEIVEDEYENLIQKYLKQNNYNVSEVEIKVNNNLRDIDQIKIVIKDEDIKKVNKINKINETSNTKYNMEDEIKKIKADIITLLDVDEKIINMTYVR